MTRVISVGISFPKNVLTKIDSERGDVPRSRYLLRAIENVLQSEEKGEWKKDCDNKSKIGSQDSIVELEACNQANPGVHKSVDPYESEYNNCRS